ncbi:unnamed protein product [Caenorhabditis bovis]|uniref:Uncharacterized protein n=1 Tax=Caenorhabditis bovis TaxID=2654633 RepID=A0A8S1EYW1_9PELO|nr:unnamed protein product [Caenorhabditis bovis]
MDIAFGIAQLILFETPYLIYVVLFAKNRKNEKELLTYPISLTFIIILSIHNALLVAKIVGVLALDEHAHGTLDAICLALIIASTTLGEAFKRFLDAPLIPTSLFILSAQRFIVILGPHKWHRAVSETPLRIALLLLATIGILYVIQTFYECRHALFVIIRTCSTKMVSELDAKLLSPSSFKAFSNSYQCSMRDSISDVLMLQIRIAVASHFVLPLMAILLYAYLALRIGKLELSSNRKMQANINVMLQTIPLILVEVVRRASAEASDNRTFQIRSTFALFMYTFYKDRAQVWEQTTAGVELCRYDTYLVLIPLGYIFGSVERWKKIRKLFRRASRVNDSATYLDNQVYTQ